MRRLCWLATILFPVLVFEQINLSDFKLLNSFSGVRRAGGYKSNLNRIKSYDLLACPYCVLELVWWSPNLFGAMEWFQIVMTD